MLRFRNGGKFLKDRVVVYPNFSAIYQRASTQSPVC
jgi:hypothetical protein